MRILPIIAYAFNIDNNMIHHKYQIFIMVFLSMGGIKNTDAI